MPIQLHLHDIVGDLHFFFHASSSTLHFSNGSTTNSLHAFGATYLGSDNRQGDFRWAWAAPELPVETRSAAMRIRDVGIARGVREFIAPHVSTTSRDDLHRIAMAVAGALDAPAFFTDFERGFALVLKEDAALPARRVESPRVEAERIIASVWSAGVRTERHAEALEAFVSQRGGVVEKHGAKYWLCFVPLADPIEVILDERQQLVSLTSVQVNNS
jgi:hypothetical protein